MGWGGWGRVGLVGMGRVLGRPFCVYKMHHKHSKLHIKVHSGSPFG